MYARYCSVQACCMRDTTSRTCGGQPPKGARGAVQGEMWAGAGARIPTELRHVCAEQHCPATSLQEISAQQEEGCTQNHRLHTCACWPAMWLKLSAPLRCAATTACNGHAQL